MFEEVLSLPLSKHCKNDFSSSKKPKHPFPLHTAAQGQGREAKLLHTLPVLKITLTHFSTSLCNVTATTIFLHLEITLEQRWLPDPGQDLDKNSRTCPAGICESRAAPGDTELSELPGEDGKAEGGKFGGRCSIGGKLLFNQVN